DGGAAIVEGAAFDGTDHRDLTDVDVVGRELLRQQADQLVLGGVDDGEAHRVELDAGGVDLRVDGGEAAVGHQDGRVLILAQVRQRLLDGRQETRDPDVERAADRRRLGGHQIPSAPVVRAPLQD